MGGGTEFWEYQSKCCTTWCSRTTVKIINEIITDVKKENNIYTNQFDNILNSDFLFEEYHRVIYGLQVGITGSEQTYLNVERKGRGRNPSLQRNSERRKLVFQCLKKYALRMHQEDVQSFTLRRQYLLSRLVNNQINFKYDYIFKVKVLDFYQGKPIKLE